MCNMDLISVIMPAYNEEKYIGEAIESILKQTYDTWELIIIDDASTDNTSSIVMQYANKDDRIKLFIFNKNQGACKALNYALEHVRGKYICWLSADDKYKPDMFSSSIKYLQEQENFQAVFSKHEVINEKSEVIDTWRPSREFLNIGKKDCMEPYRTLLFVGNAFNACSLMAETECFKEAGGFQEKHPYAGDYDCMLRLASCGNIGYIDKINVESRKHSEQVTNEGKNDLDAIKVFSEMIYDDNLRQTLFHKAGVMDGRDTILMAYGNREKMYQQLNLNMEEELCKSQIEEFLNTFPLILQADRYCKQVAKLVGDENWDLAIEMAKAIPEETQAFIDNEKWCIILANILEHQKKYQDEKDMLDIVLKMNPNNYEAEYMLGNVYEQEGMAGVALKFYIASVQNSNENEDDFEVLISNLKRFLNENY